MAAAWHEPLRWLKANGHDLGGLTGQDTRALVAVAWCWETYAAADSAGRVAAVQAVRALLRAMQPSVRPFARELIARSLDWEERDAIWPVVAGVDVSKHPAIDDVPPLSPLSEHSPEHREAMARARAAMPETMKRTKGENDA